MSTNTTNTTNTTQAKQANLNVLDFTKITDFDKVEFQWKKTVDNDKTVQFHGPVVFDSQPMRIRTPYMRTPRGLVESNFNGKTEYYFELSLGSNDFFDECYPNNQKNVAELKSFVEKLELHQKMFMAENMASLLKMSKNSNKESFKTVLNDLDSDLISTSAHKSLIQISTDPNYADKFNFRITKDIEHGEYVSGLVLEQDFDHENKKFKFIANDQGKQTLKFEPSLISNISKHAQVRLQLLAGAYFVFDLEDPLKSSCGIKWTFEQIMFINSPYAQPKEMLFTSCNFDDITPEFEPTDGSTNVKMLTNEQSHTTPDLIENDSGQVTPLKKQKAI